MTGFNNPTISPADRALLETDTTGVQEEVERIRREVNSGFYLALIRQRIASVVDSVFHQPRLAQRLGGRGYRTSATTRRKYQKIAETNIAQDEDPKMQGPILAIVGNQVCFVKRSALKAWQRKYVADIVSSLCPGGSLVEVGAGDLATLVGVAKVIESRPRRLGAVDISERRLAVGRLWSERQHVNVSVMCAANGVALPFADNEWDVVITAHCLEQNSEPLSVILRELHRVSGRYLVLMEPSYELGRPLHRRMILRDGHVRGIPAAVGKLGFDVVRHELLPVRPYKSDVALTVIAKRTDS